MKKKLLTLGFMSAVGTAMFAQESQPGFPASFNVTTDIQPSVIKMPAMDYDQIFSEIDESQPGPYMVAKLYDQTLSFPESGVFFKDELTGNTIWKAAVHLPGAKGIGLFFDQFRLPQRVNMFIHNNNKKHILGAYTSINNEEGLDFNTEAVEGNTAHIEINFGADVNPEDILLHMNMVAGYYRGVEDLYYFSDDYTDYGTMGEYDAPFFGSSSTCMINARCPQGDGFAVPREASVATLTVQGSSIGMCSATMVNVIGNSEANCTRYVLTASHCESSGSLTSAITFNSYIIKFRYEHPTCAWTNDIPNSTSIRGVTCVARSVYPVPANQLKGDFMLLKIGSNRTIPDYVTLSGWNSRPTIATSYTEPDKFVGFHHPNGDIKKVSYTRRIQSRTIGASGSHWNVDFIEGYSHQGSSGSGLFNRDKQLIGIASVAVSGLAPAECKTARNGESVPNTSTDLSYSKLSYCWTEGEADNRQLKPWLDPNNTGETECGAADYLCRPISSSVAPIESLFNGDFQIFPNPSKDGLVRLNIKMNETTKGKIEVMDITGRVILVQEMPKLSSQIVDVNLSQYANGIYLIRISNDFGHMTKKVILNK